MNKKILFITYTYLPIIGGIEQNIYKITGFLKKDYDIDIITKPLKDQKSEEKIGRANVIRMNFSEFKNYSYEKYDIIIIENFNIMPHFNVFKKLTILKKLGKLKARIILVPHGGFTVDWKTFSFLRRTIKKVYNRTKGIYFINNLVDKIIAVSNWEKEALIKEGINKDIAIIRNGIDEFRNTNKKDNYFIFVGRIDPIKNIKEIILTFKKIKENPKFADYDLKIIGDYKKNIEYYNFLKEIIKNNNLSNSIKFLGEKLGNKKIDILSKAKCLICLSKMENDPIVIKEAFSVKTKVLINTNYGLNDYKNENNIFVKENNDLDTEKLFKFLKKPFINKFKIPLLTWKEVAHEYQRIFEE